VRDRTSPVGAPKYSNSSCATSTWLVSRPTTAGNATTTGAHRSMTSTSIEREVDDQEHGRSLNSTSVLTCGDAPG
jgi:hypothetical protein